MAVDEEITEDPKTYDWVIVKHTDSYATLYAVAHRDCLPPHSTICEAFLEGAWRTKLDAERALQAMNVAPGLGVVAMQRGADFLIIVDVQGDLDRSLTTYAERGPCRLELGELECDTQ